MKDKYEKQKKRSGIDQRKQPLQNFILRAL